MVLEGVTGSLVYRERSDTESGMVFLIPSKTFSCMSILDESLPFGGTVSSSVMKITVRSACRVLRRNKWDFKKKSHNEPHEIALFID